MEEISCEELLAAQKKEKKELIAKTQKMKHSVPKGDKKKKREVTAEIAQMLADLDIKHENEMKEHENKALSTEKSKSIDDIDTNSEPKVKEDIDDVNSEGKLKDDIDDVNSEAKVKDDTDEANSETKVKKDIDSEKNVSDKAEESGQVIPRLSKAQKRRNKKAMLEKERNKAIAEQELKNLSGVRNLEFEGIMKKLSEKNLTIYEVPSDGDCLYKAVQHQLSFLGLKEMTVKSLREKTSTYLLSHMDDYAPFLTCPETGDVLTEEQYIKYCEDIKTTAWGGHVEIQALSHICEVCIEIIQAQGPNILSGKESNPKILLCYHRHAYELGEHYNSVISIDSL